MKVTVEDGSGKVTIEPGAAKATWDGETMAGVVVKADAELRQTLCVAYPANRADKAVAADGHRDFASKDAVRKAAHSFLTESPFIGLCHADGTEGAGLAVESFIWDDDWTAKGYSYQPQDGDWMLKIQWDEPAWQMIKSGEITGVSMQGKARRGKPSAEAIAALRS